MKCNHCGDVNAIYVDHIHYGGGYIDKQCQLCADEISHFLGVFDSYSSFPPIPLSLSELMKVREMGRRLPRVGG